MSHLLKAAETYQTMSVEGACERAQVPQSYLTLCDPGDYSPPGSSIHAILQARILEWGAMSSSRRPS